LGKNITINGTNGIIAKDVVINKIEADISALRYNQRIYNIEAECTSRFFTTQNLLYLPYRICPPIQECTIEIDGKKIPAYIMSYEVSQSQLYLTPEVCLTQIIIDPPLERITTFFMTIYSIDLEEKEYIWDDEYQSDVPIKTRWEILDL
jgi:hypothetical protein